MLVVGSGFSGLGLAIKLARSGRMDFLVIERGATVGGTWRDNTYPGATCDVPSQLYSFSFAPNPDWTRSFSPQPEIQRYLETVAQTSGVLKNHLFDCELLSATWEDGIWAVETSQGRFTATVLVTAFGALSQPALPALPGIESFRGEVMHSARWNHDVDLRGKRVAMIGTGASAIQIVPAIADVVEHLDVYQRTAPWVLPRRDRAYRPWERTVYRRVPGYQRAVRGLLYAGREITALGFCYQPRILGLVEKQALANINRGIEDAGLRRAVTPTYRMGCKRVLISNDYYPTLARPNVELVTDPIVSVGPNLINSDVDRSVDVIISATGFHVTDSPAAELIKGADGRTLAARWAEFGMQAYKGSTVAGFPNLFSIIGPNTGLGHTSMVYMIESQLNYVMDALAVMDRDDLATVEVRADVQDEYNAALQKRMARTIWSKGGCVSWYLDDHGRNTTLWPDFTFKFRRITRQFDPDAYTSMTRGDVTA